MPMSPLLSVLFGVINELCMSVLYNLFLSVHDTLIEAKNYSYVLHSGNLRETLHVGPTVEIIIFRQSSR